MNAPATIPLSRIADVVGAPNVITDSQALAAYSVDSIAPQIAARPASAQEVSELVKFAVAEKLAIIPTGARTKLGIGMPPSRYDLAIDMTRLDRVISYDPGDLTLSVEPGIPLVRLAKVLAEHNQFLPLAVPFYESATVGGSLASGVDSSLRQFYGTARDFVLGTEFVSGDGALTKSGGRVVKNVSGYDLHKLFLGSIGSLGVITRVNFKTFPLPVRMQTWLASFASIADATDFSQRVRGSLLAPRSIDILSGWSPIAANVGSSDSPRPTGGVFPSSSSGKVLVSLSAGGTEVVLKRYSNELWRVGEATHARSLVTLTDDEQEWHQKQIRELSQVIVSENLSATVLRASVLPSQIGSLIEQVEAMLQASHCLSGTLSRASGIVYVFVLPLDTMKNALSKLTEACNKFFELAGKMNASATIPWCPLELKRQLNIWGPPREDFILHQRVKRAFDPHNIFAPGRFVGGL